MKNSIDTIYFDIDGVLADFESGIENATGELFNYIKSLGPNSINDVLEKNVWGDFYARLDPSPDFPYLKEFMERLVGFGYKVKILSSVSEEHPDEVASQKTRWLENNGLNHFDVHFVETSSEKSKFATPDSLLIDDRQKAVGPFREAGGKAILYKQGQFDDMVHQFVMMVD